MKSATEPWIRFTALASKRKISEGMWKKMLDYTLEMLVGDGTISFWLPLHLYILGSTRVKRKRETDGRYIYDVYIAQSVILTPNVASEKARENVFFEI